MFLAQCLILHWPGTRNFNNVENMSRRLQVELPDAIDRGSQPDASAPSLVNHYNIREYNNNFYRTFPSLSAPQL